MEILGRGASRISFLDHTEDTFLPSFPSQDGPRQAVTPQQKLQWHKGAACSAVENGKAGLFFSTRFYSVRHFTFFLHK